MRGELRDGEVVVGGDARQRFHDASGYGRPLSGDEVALSRVEAAHLLLRGDLDAVVEPGAGRPTDFRAFFAASTDVRADFAVRFLVFADLRSRGFYLSPAREGWVPEPAEDVDFVVYPRGKGPGDGAVEYRVRAVGERRAVPAAALGERTLAVVDEESAVTYLETNRVDPEGATGIDLPAGLDADLLGDRALAWDPPAELHLEAFYGQPLAGRDDAAVDALQLSLVEAAYLAARGALAVGGDGSDGGEDERTRAGPADPSDPTDRADSADPADPTDGTGSADRTDPARGSDPTDRADPAGRAAGSTPSSVDRGTGSDAYEAVVDAGRAVEGERFDRRLRAYAALREAGVVPKTGFKFGADFRTYAEVTDVEALGHSERLVRVLADDHEFVPRDLALDVRLAHGVRKEMVFALVPDAGDVEWLAVRRLTP